MVVVAPHLPSARGAGLLCARDSPPRSPRPCADDPTCRSPASHFAAPAAAAAAVARGPGPIPRWSTATCRMGGTGQMGARGLEVVRAYAACDGKAAIASPGSGTRVFFRSRRARGACWRTVGARRPAPAASARARTPTPRLPHARSQGLTSQAMRMLSPSQDGAMRGVDHALGATPLFPMPIFGHAAKLRVP